MIQTIESSLATFKQLQFHEGLNIILADTNPEATDKQTRNSAGKTSVVEVVHFLLGANCGPDSIFRTAELIEHTFSMTLTIKDEVYKIQRGGHDPSKILVLEGGEKRPELLTRNLPDDGGRVVSNTNWRNYLGHVFFQMPANPKGTEYEELFTPSFRSMFSYFARRWKSSGFLEPQLHSVKQRRWDWQVNLAYLLGLDWRIVLGFEKVRSRERTLDELKKAAKQGAFGNVISSVAELRPQVAIAETRAAKLRGNLASFQVLESYRELAQRAARAKTEMQDIGREMVSLRERLQHLEQALAAETPAASLDLRRLYESVGVELPGVAVRRFDEVHEFYESVVANRRVHLQDEMNRVSDRLQEADHGLSKLDLDRSETLRNLEGKGALEDFVRLQRELADLEASAAALRERFKAAVVLEGESTQLDFDRVNLKKQLQADFQAKEEVLRKAVLAVAELISGLYDDRTGQLVIEATDNGPEFRISIEGDRGGGIASMEIFCFDMALFLLVTERIGGPGFLIHDSHLFDGVDERQIAAALWMGRNVAEAQNQQYIVTMNSDVYNRLPLRWETEKLNPVLQTRLSDNTETGGLFGIRF